MHIHITDRTTSKSNDNELNIIRQELNNAQEKIDFKYKEVSILSLFNYLDNNYINEDIHLFANLEQECVMKSYVEQKNDNDNQLIGKEIADYLILPNSFVNYIGYSDNGICFKNNEDGRNTVLKWLLADKWLEWKEESEKLDFHEKIESNLNNSGKTSKKIKV